MEKEMFFLFGEKTTTCGKVSLIHYVFLHFFSFFFFVSVFFSSSFKVNLKIHYRNWCVTLLLAPMKTTERGPEAVHASFSEK